MYNRQVENIGRLTYHLQFKQCWKKKFLLLQYTIYHCLL